MKRALKGKRMVSCTELSEDEKFDEAQVKTLTGGGTIYGRDLYKDRQTFPNYAKIVMETNEVPRFV
jgi:putative DNA primase/helicase